MSILNHYKPRYPHYKHFEPGRFFWGHFPGRHHGVIHHHGDHGYLRSEGSRMAGGGEVTGEVGEWLVNGWRFNILWNFEAILEACLKSYQYFTLVGGLEHVLFPCIGNNNRNWRTHIFQRGRVYHQPVTIFSLILELCQRLPSGKLT